MAGSGTFGVKKRDIVPLALKGQEPRVLFWKGLVWSCI